MCEIFFKIVPGTDTSRFMHILHSTADDMFIQKYGMFDTSHDGS